MSKIDPKQEMINRIKDTLVDRTRELQREEDTDVQDRLVQMDVILDTMKFLNDYDENVKVLNKHLKEKGKRFDKSR